MHVGPRRPGPIVVDGLRAQAPQLLGLGIRGRMRRTGRAPALECLAIGIRAVGIKQARQPLLGTVGHAPA